MTQKRLATSALNYCLESGTGTRSLFPAHSGQRRKGDDKAQTQDRYPTFQLCCTTDHRGLKTKISLSTKGEKRTIMKKFPICCKVGEAVEVNTHRHVGEISVVFSVLPALRCCSRNQSRKRHGKERGWQSSEKSQRTVAKKCGEATKSRQRQQLSSCSNRVVLPKRFYQLRAAT